VALCVRLSAADGANSRCGGRREAAALAVCNVIMLRTHTGTLADCEAVSSSRASCVGCRQSGRACPQSRVGASQSHVRQMRRWCVRVMLLHGPGTSRQSCAHHSACVCYTSVVAEHGLLLTSPARRAFMAVVATNFVATAAMNTCLKRRARLLCSKQQGAGVQVANVQVGACVLATTLARISINPGAPKSLLVSQEPCAMRTPNDTHDCLQVIVGTV
jgi:hypothetical protein